MVPAGTRFQSATANIYETTAEAVVGADGTIAVAVKAAAAGRSGNALLR